MINNKFKKQRQKNISFKTKMRYFLLGKLPLERKYVPKIIEYLFIVFANLVILIALIFIFMLFYSINFHFNEANLKIIVNQIKTFSGRILIILIVSSWLISTLMCIHLGYIFSKTEKGKMWCVFCIICNVLGLVPLTVIFAILGYIKNEIAFE
ncbi:hypothetical protein [Mycoplasmopsis cricetuli]|uniref:hypothetical protein n=1 Tax=Mycoplasmopsis cricetuli TaxID=171283 RepID=UPI000471BB39|nr:hypothetical protein [Mycoplasmopsis cricetuli]